MHTKGVKQIDEKDISLEEIKKAANELLKEEIFTLKEEKLPFKEQI